RSVGCDLAPVSRLDDSGEVPSVRSDDHGAMAQRLRRDQRIGFQALGWAAASARLAGTRPKLRSSSPVRGRHRRVFELAAELVEAGKALLSPDVEELAPELVVDNLGHQQLMSLGGLDRPDSGIGEFAGMADLAEHRGVEQKPHARLADESSGRATPTSGSWNRTTSVGSQSGSSRTSSFAHRRNIASIRAARSCRITSGSERGSFAGRAIRRAYQSRPQRPTEKVSSEPRSEHAEVSTGSSLSAISRAVKAPTVSPLYISSCSE